MPDLTCTLCHTPTPFGHAVPTMHGEVVSNDFPDWLWERDGGRVPVCERCYQWHAQGRVAVSDRKWLANGALTHGAGI